MIINKKKDYQRCACKCNEDIYEEASSQMSIQSLYIELEDFSVEV